MAPPRHSVKKQESSWPEYIKGEGDLAIYPTSPAKSFPLFGAPK
jgi:hypothetical protein